MKADRNYPFKISKVAGMILLAGQFLSAGCHSGSGQAGILPAVVSRAGWKAEQPDFHSPGENGIYDPISNPDGWMVYSQPLSQVLKVIVVHHSALPQSEGVTEIQRLHMRERGYADIGYHFVIDQTGVIFEGRSIAVRGAHTGGHNTGTVGIVLLGNFEKNAPDKKQYDSLKKLVQALAAKYKITNLAGHCDFQPGKTLCPGQVLEAELPSLAMECGLVFGLPNH